MPRGRDIASQDFFETVILGCERPVTRLVPGAQSLPRCHWPAERTSAHKEEEEMRRIALFTLLAGFLVPVLMSAPAHAQPLPIRTWVSGVGDDTNTSFGCSRTATCKTFAAAISVTDTNGEINCTDPGGFGTLTITKSITIDCTGTFGGILAASGASGITINLSTNPDPLKSVTLRGLSINGAGNAGQAGLRGVSILSAALVTLDNVVIMNFTQQGVADVRSAPGRLFIKNSVIRNNAGVGILVGATGANVASVENTHSLNNLYGLVTGNGNQVRITRSVFSGNSQAGIEADPSGQAGVEHSTVNFNTYGLQTGGTIWFSDTDISFNSAAISGPTISFGDNRIYGNSIPGTAPTVGAASSDHGKQ
jgi:hypothetical protein